MISRLWALVVLLVSVLNMFIAGPAQVAIVSPLPMTASAITMHSYDGLPNVSQQAPRAADSSDISDRATSKPEVVGTAKPVSFPPHFVAAETAASGAEDAANGARLSGQLARESAESAFTSSGRLSQGAIRGSREIVSGSELGNPSLIKALTSDGSSIGDWGKYTTRAYQSPSGDFQAHFYMNGRTGAVNYDFDYKVVFSR